MALSNAIIALDKKKEAGLAQFVRIRRQLDTILDDEIQVLTHADLAAAKDAARRTARRANMIIIALIFDPYFTTRKQGSGLGLFSCYSIITQHGGWITVNSEPGKGATFTFFLPAAGDVEVTADGPPLLQRGSGRVLVMDDEETIRRGLAALLETLGYEVVVTADGEEAIEAYRERLEQKEPFDVVIMDLTVPGGMGGGVAVQRLLELDPKVKTIVSSGYATDPIMAKHKENGFQGVLVKPFTPEDLSKVMKEVLA